MSRSVRMLALLAVLFASAACRPSGARVVGVVPKGATHIFWQTVHAGAIKAAGEFGYMVDWNAPALEIDASRQIEIVDAMINRRVAGIVLAPVDKQALVAVVERAWQKGIPVAIFDSAIDTDKIVSYVATDNTEAGRMAARRMGEILGGKGKVGIVGFMPGSASTMEREHGFQHETRRRFPEIDIVGLQFGMADRAKAMAVTENILAAHPDLAGVFADNESSSAGALQGAKVARGQPGKAGGVRCVGPVGRQPARRRDRFAGGAESVPDGLRKHSSGWAEAERPEPGADHGFRSRADPPGGSGAGRNQATAVPQYSEILETQEVDPVERRGADTLDGARVIAFHSYNLHRIVLINDGANRRCTLQLSLACLPLPFQPKHAGL